MPLIRRLPKRGFNNAAFHKRYAIVNLSDLKDFKSGSVVNEESLRAANLVRGNFDGIKILGGGELKHGLTIEAERSARRRARRLRKPVGASRKPKRRAPRERIDRMPMPRMLRSQTEQKPARSSRLV